MKNLYLFSILLFLSAYTVIGQEINQRNENVKSDLSQKKTSKSTVSQKEDNGVKPTPGTDAQTIKMCNGSVTTCFGQFFDSGGPDRYYTANENYTYTLNSGVEGSNFILRFVEFSIGTGDNLTVYDGNSTSTRVIGTFSKSNPMPFELKSTGGSLTFVFNSDGQRSDLGWRASIACYIGERKILKSDGIAPSVRLIFSIHGVKTEDDAQLIKDKLSRNEYVLNCSLDREKNMIAVTATAETFKEVIMEQIRSAKDVLGYEISVEYREMFHSK